MRAFILMIIMIAGTTVIAQKIPHGMVYGAKPSRVQMIMATNLEKYMGKRTRISTSIYGRVTQVTKAKGGWFDVDAGNGQIITAHFKNYGINLPIALKNHRVMMDGVAQKQFITDDTRHGKPHAPRVVLMFEVKGLSVE